MEPLRAMKPPSPDQIRFPIEPRLVPARKAARRLHRKRGAAALSIGA